MKSFTQKKLERDTFYMEQENYSIITLNIELFFLFEGPIFLKLKPSEFLEKVYLTSDKHKGVMRKFKEMDKSCNFLYILNDNKSKDKVIKFQENKANIMSSFHEENGLGNIVIIITDCILCKQVCSTLTHFPMMKELSDIWGICKHCYVENYGL